MTETPAATTAESVRPEAFDNPVTPYLILEGARDAIAFYVDALGATELGCFDGPDGRVLNACVEISGVPVMLMDANPEWGAMGPKDLGGTSTSIHLTVHDTDAAFARAVAAGATAKMEPQDMFWGDRFASITDPFGHAWSFGQPIRTVSRDEMAAAARDAGMQ